MPHDDLWIDAPRDSTILARKYIEYVQKTVNWTYAFQLNHCIGVIMQK